MLLGKNFKNPNPFSFFLDKNFNLTLDNNLKKELIKNRVLSDYSSSGRIEIWNEALKLFEKNKVFGYGPQGDRFILKKFKFVFRRQLFNHSVLTNYIYAVFM